jgi:hypothetical protein
MKYLLIACALLAACDGPRFACIDGAMYLKAPGEGGVWRMVDAAPAHQGITPIPCKQSNPEGQSK